MLQQQNASDYESGIHVTMPYQLYFEAYVYGGERNLGSMGPDLMSPREGYLLKAGGWTLEAFPDSKFQYENLINWRMNAFSPQSKGVLIFSSTLLRVLNYFQV